MKVPKAPGVLEGPGEQGDQILRLQALQDKHLAAGQKGPVDLEGGIFGGGPD